MSSAVNEGLKRVKGDYLCWPEYDDILISDSVERKVCYLETHKDCAVVTSDAWLVEDNDITKVTGVLSHHNPNRFDRNHFSSVDDQFHFYCGVPHDSNVHV